VLEVHRKCVNNGEKKTLLDWWLQSNAVVTV